MNMLSNNIQGGYQETLLNQKRNITIDLIKGMGILLMVFRHTEAPYSEFVLLFHMAIFFIASGYLLDTDKVRDVKSLRKFIFRKIKGLWLPYFLYMSIFQVLNNFFVECNVYTNNPLYLKEYTGRYAMLTSKIELVDVFKSIFRAATFRGTAQVGGALWFFYTLFLLIIGYTSIEFILKIIFHSKKMCMYTQTIISILLLCIGYVLYIKGKYVYGLNRFCSFYSLIYIGQILKGRMEIILKQCNLFVIVVSNFIILCVARSFGHIDLAGNNIQNPVYFILVSVAGWFMMYSIAEILKQKNFVGNKAIIYLSVHSVPIIALHFLAFKIINYIAVQVYNMGDYMIAGFPVLMHGLWWIPYMISGIMVPLILDRVYIICKKRILKK